MEAFNSEKFSSRVNELLKEWHCPGVAIALVQDDKTSSRAFGRACMEPEKPMTTDTLFDIASSSKSLTAAAVALLVEDERYPQLKWDAKMCELLPDDFVMSEDSYTRDITVEDILSHRTGLPSHDLSYKHSDTPRSVTRNLRNLQLTKPIRTAEQYCNMMYTVATHVIETLTGKTFQCFLQENFWTPLGMTSTHLQPDSAKAAGLGDRMITPYHWERTTQAFNSVKLQQIPEAQGAGSVWTSVDDYILWVKAMLNHEDPVTDAVYKGLITPRIICDLDGGELEPFSSHPLYCTGLGTSFYRGYELIAHTGGDPGVGSYHFFLPALKFGGVLLGNGGYAGSVLYALARELIDERIGVPPAERPDWNAREHKETDEYHDSSDNAWKKPLDLPTESDVPAFEPLTRELEAYTGTYTNAGYHALVVEVKDGSLFIDATDRTMGFWLTLEHVRDQRDFVGHMVEYYDGCKGKMAVKYKFDSEGRGGGERACRIGVDLEDAAGDLIWFGRVS